MQDQAIEGFEAETAPIYAGENNVTQGGVDVTTLPDNVGADTATEAYDEPLTMADVNTIASLFIKA